MLANSKISQSLTPRWLSLNFELPFWFVYFLQSPLHKAGNSHLVWLLWVVRWVILRTHQGVAVLPNKRAAPLLSANREWDRSLPHELVAAVEATWARQYLQRWLPTRWVYSYSRGDERRKGVASRTRNISLVVVEERSYIVGTTYLWSLPRKWLISWVWFWVMALSLVYFLWIAASIGSRIDPSCVSDPWWSCFYSSYDSYSNSDFPYNH